MSEQNAPKKIKVLKKGKRKTRKELEDSFRRLTISQIRVGIQLYPEEARKILSEMLNNAV